LLVDEGPAVNKPDCQTGTQIDTGTAADTDVSINFHLFPFVFKELASRSLLPAITTDVKKTGRQPCRCRKIVQLRLRRKWFPALFAARKRK